MRVIFTALAVCLGACSPAPEQTPEDALREDFADWIMVVGDGVAEAPADKGRIMFTIRVQAEAYEDITAAEDRIGAYADRQSDLILAGWYSVLSAPPPDGAPEQPATGSTEDVAFGRIHVEAEGAVEALRALERFLEEEIGAVERRQASWSSSITGPARQEALETAIADAHDKALQAAEARGVALAERQILGEIDNLEGSLTATVMPYQSGDPARPVFEVRVTVTAAYAAH